MKLHGGVRGGGGGGVEPPPWPPMPMLDPTPPIPGMETRVGDGEEEGGEGELDDTLDGGEGDSSALGPANSRVDCPPPEAARLLPAAPA